MTTQEPEARCPACGCLNECVADLDGDHMVTEAGDAMICAICVTLCIATGVGNETRLPSEEERAKIMADPRVLDVIGKMLLMKASRDT